MFPPVGETFCFEVQTPPSPNCGSVYATDVLKLKATERSWFWLNVYIFVVFRASSLKRM